MKEYASLDKILDVSETLFTERGFASVTLRDIAKEAGIKHTSLYHHVPGGKEELFIRVMERMMHHHNEGLLATIREKAPDLNAQLYAVADWFLSHPPFDLVRFTYSDLPRLKEDEARRLSSLSYSSLFFPIIGCLTEAQDAGIIETKNIQAVAGSLIGMVESLFAIPEYVLEQGYDRKQIAHDVIDILIRGMHPNTPTEKRR